MNELVGTFVGWWYVYPHMAIALSQLMFIYINTPYVNMLSKGGRNAVTTYI